MRQFHGHEKALVIEMRVRTLALEEVDPVAPQVNRVKKERSGSLDVGELNENIEKFTKLLANMNISGEGRRMGHVKCFSCGETGHIARYCRSDVQRPYPSRGIEYLSKPLRGKTLRAAGEQPAVVKLDKESVADMDDVVEMREVIVRTRNDRCTLVKDMTINNHCLEAVVDSGEQVSLISRRLYDSLSCRPRPVESIRMKSGFWGYGRLSGRWCGGGPRRWPWKLHHDNVCSRHYRQLYYWFVLSKGPCSGYRYKPGSIGG